MSSQLIGQLAVWLIFDHVVVSCAYGSLNASLHQPYHGGWRSAAGGCRRRICTHG